MYMHVRMCTYSCIVSLVGVHPSIDDLQHYLLPPKTEDCRTVWRWWNLLFDRPRDVDRVS